MKLDKLFQQKMTSKTIEVLASMSKIKPRTLNLLYQIDLLLANLRILSDSESSLKILEKNKITFKSLQTTVRCLIQEYEKLEQIVLPAVFFLESMVYDDVFDIFKEYNSETGFKLKIEEIGFPTKTKKCIIEFTTLDELIKFITDIKQPIIIHQQKREYYIHSTTKTFFPIYGTITIYDQCGEI